jgi:hypothetical protein
MAKLTLAIPATGPTASAIALIVERNLVIFDLSTPPINIAPLFGWTVSNDGIAILALPIFVTCVLIASTAALIVERNLVIFDLSTPPINKTPFFRRSLANNFVSKLTLAILATHAAAFLFAFILVDGFVKLSFAASTIDETPFF